MFGIRQNPAAAYKKVSVEMAVETADPHRLTLMLFEGARAAIVMARAHMEHGRVAEKGAAISNAIDIVNNGLLASLDMQKGGELAERLAALYEYICRRLLWANLKDDLAALEEAKSLLGELESAWALISPSAQLSSSNTNHDVA